MFSFKRFTRIVKEQGKLRIFESCYVINWWSILLLYVKNLLFIALGVYIAIALSDGSMDLLRKLYELGSNKTVDWHLCHVFWVEEHAVPIMNVFSNYSLARGPLLCKLDSLCRYLLVIIIYLFVVPVGMRDVRPVIRTDVGALIRSDNRPSDSRFAPENAHLRLVIEVVNNDGVRIFGVERGRVINLSEFVRAMLDAWCRRHLFQPSYREFFLERVPFRSSVALWFGQEQTWYFFDGGVHLELPQDLFFLERVLVVESRDFLSVSYGAGFQFRRDFIGWMTTYLAAPENAHLRLVIEVVNNDGVRIHLRERGRVINLTEYEREMLDAWCRRHLFQPSYRESFLQRARFHSCVALWFGQEQTWYFFDGGVHLELPEDLFSLERVLVVESRDFLSVSYGAGFQSRRDFMVWMVRYLAVPVDYVIVIRIPQSDPSFFTLLQVYNHHGSLIYEEHNLFWGNYKSFELNIYGAWMLRHQIDEEFSRVLDSPFARRRPPTWWPGEQQIWYMYNGMLHLELPEDEDLPLLRNIVVYEREEMFEQQFGLDIDFQALLANFIGRVL